MLKFFVSVVGRFAHYTTSTRTVNQHCDTVATAPALRAAMPGLAQETWPSRLSIVTRPDVDT